MKIRKEYVILAVIILALSFYILKRSPNRTEYLLPKLPGISVEDISKIEIQAKDTTVVLNKKDNTWHIDPQGYPADTGKVKDMLDIITKLNLTTLVSESKNYDLYDLDSDAKININAWSGNTLARNFEVGKAATSAGHTFIKLADDYRVFHARGSFRGNFDKSADDLRDKIVLSFDKTKIQEIKITKGRQALIFNRKQVPVEISADKEKAAQDDPSLKTKTVWQTAEGEKADESKLKSLLATLSKLNCEKYIKGKNKENFENPIYIIQLKGLKEYTLSIFEKTDKEAKNHPAISSENNYPFVLSDWKSKNIMKNPEELLEKKMPDKS